MRTGIGLALSGALLTSTMLVSSPALAEEYLVSNQAEFVAAEKKLVAGDIIIMANGEWRDFEIKISGKGKKDKPIVLISETAGKVILTGQSSLRIGGDHILVTGLVFRDGYSPRGEVISFRRSKEDVATNSRVTEVVIDNFSKPDRFESDYWVAMYGRNNRFDHNHLVGKTNKGVTLAVRLDSKENRENHHRIDHNYFGPRPVLGSNGGETIRIGTSKYSMYDSNTLVENNVFDRCDGEIEIVSNKSGGNIYRGNLFLRSSGTLTLRHGDGNLVENNVFMGHDKDHTGGIRVINRKQTVRNNYMEGLSGTGFASALTVMNGVPNSPVNRYVQVDEALIEHNSIYNSKQVTLGGGADEERSAPPVNSVFRDNILGGIDGKKLIRIDADISGIKFSGNRLSKGTSAQPIDGVTSTDIETSRAENGLLYPVNPALADIGASRDLKPISPDKVGASWYPKPSNDSVFGKGKVIQVQPGEDKLTEAFTQASEGDTLLLASGEYIVNKTLPLGKSVSIIGQSGNKADDQKPGENSGVRIAFTRPSLVEIHQGGNLQLENLAISGDLAPDSVGNAVIRTASYPIKSNFIIEMKRVSVSNLNVNKSFHVIALGKSSMADQVKIQLSQFDNITGTVVLAAAETEDYGQFNADYVDIQHNVFRNVTGGIANLYRGGRDESTFGPHFTLKNNAIENVGSDKAGAEYPSLLLHGVQYGRVEKNSFLNSASPKIVQTVGTPDVRITDNVFAATPAPVVEELVWQGPSRINLEHNSYRKEGSL